MRFVKTVETFRSEFNDVPTASSETSNGGGFHCYNKAIRKQDGEDKALL